VTGFSCLPTICFLRTGPAGRTGATAAPWSKSGIHEQLPNRGFLQSAHTGDQLDDLVNLVELDIIVLPLEVDLVDFW